MAPYRERFIAIFRLSARRAASRFRDKSFSRGTRAQIDRAEKLDGKIRALQVCAVIRIHICVWAQEGERADIRHGASVYRVGREKNKRIDIHAVGRYASYSIYIDVCAVYARVYIIRISEETGIKSATRPSARAYREQS